VSKYGNKKVIVDGIQFDSKAEAAYYKKMLKDQEAGLVKEFNMQKTYTLLDKFEHPKTGKAVRAIKYIADFEVIYPDGRVEVVDIKGFKTPIYRLKEKLFMFRYNIPIVCLKYRAKTNSFEEV